MTTIITLVLLIAGLVAIGVFNYRSTLRAARRLVETCSRD